MVFVLVISWLRFFFYFLVVKEISRMLLTLFEMLYDTLSFIFIVICYLVIVASVFTTLFQDVNPTYYGGLTVSTRTLFDASMAVYTYDGMGTQELSHAVLMICHTFFANILLMNFLIAILSSTYENMQQSATFKYKVNLYQYCERYILAYENESYGELILHAPPICYLTSLILIFIPSKIIMKGASKVFSYMMFWLENILFVLFFLIFELVLLPVVFGKTFLNIPTST